MIFQTLDDKSECVGVYLDGALYFDRIPENLTKTWKYTGSIQDPAVEYAWLYCGGRKLEEVCPDHLKDELKRLQGKFRAYLLSLQIGKISLREHCFFDLVGKDFLLEFCEIRNKITEHVFETFEKPENYSYLDQAYKLIHKIKYQELNLNIDDCRHLMTTSTDREAIQKILNHKKHYIDYNLFGTVTGRLTTFKDSNPILNMRARFRSIIKPTNDWFVSFDYNGAEIRTFLSLSGHKQPPQDIHMWNVDHLYQGRKISREDAKTLFFSSFYNQKDFSLKDSFYDREKVLKENYSNGKVKTPFGRVIDAVEEKAFSYLIQSTTSDLTIDRAVEIDKALEGTESKVAFIVHDEIVLDLKEEDRYKIPDLKVIFENNKLDKFMSNIKAGKSYGEMKVLKL